jgi:hypothetical protein
VTELQQFADRHPYFGAAQLLLTKKLQTENAVQYNEQLQKTFLFFNNPLWVEQLLNETGNATIIKSESDLAGTLNISTVSSSANNENEMKVSGISIPETKTEKNEIEIPALGTDTDNKIKEELVFEPFHTVDYFASLGIKIKEEEKPKDKLGLQLKSFTDWLKTMKRLAVTENTVATEPQAEQKVEQLAEHSLQDREIITEAMAEVWSKQGNNSKEIEIYSKLSLLDPSKNVYFASKIEDLKKSI